MTAYGGGRLKMKPAVQTRAEAQARDLDKLVCEFCAAVGEPIPVDAIAQARDYRENAEPVPTDRPDPSRGFPSSTARRIRRAMPSP